MEGIASDKVNINVGGGEGGGGGGAMAALVAALGNRNQGDNSAALIAALGNRNQGDNTAALIAAMGNRRDDHDGMGAMWPIILLALLGKRGGIGGGDDDCGHGGIGAGHAALLQTLLEGQADLRAEVPTMSLEIQNAICAAIARSDLATQQGFANVKDSVQAAAALNLSATNAVGRDVATGTLTNVIAIKDDGEKTRLLITNFNNENLQRELVVAQSDLRHERSNRHADGVEVRVSQNVNQQQAQAQAQTQVQANFDRLFSRLHSIEIEQQVARATNANLIIGSTGVATGPQTSNPVNVR